MKIEINNKEYNTGNALTILEVASQNGIYIPSLCAHPELTPYGGCRLCIVEVEGKRGYPTACTTLLEDGMVVRTETQVLQEMRKELIQMILSEHTSACLVCDEVNGCGGFQETIRKVGVTTGCRWCPKDKDCELQKVVNYLDIHELTLPGLYRAVPVEKYDPFFDRDYNLCIYCGRCVRICTEHRKSNVLALRQRGNKTTIGPAYEDSHIDADCEFCGACVSVCPTGAMSEKSRKWWGIPEEFKPSVCPLCSLNCDLQAITLKNKIVGTLPPGEPHQSGGELCVKGRFCLSELVNRTERIQEPQFLYPEGYGFVSWDLAIQKAGEILNSVAHGRSAMFISPCLTLEEISAAGLFAGKVMKTTAITSSCMVSDLMAYMDMAWDSSEVKEINKESVIVSFFLNGNYNYAPLTMAVKTAAEGGARYFQAGWIKDTTSRFARKRLIPEPGKETDFFDRIISCLETGKKIPGEIQEMADALRQSKDNVIIVSPEIMSFNNCRELLDRIKKIRTMTGAKLVMPNQYANLYGLLSHVKIKSLDDVNNMIRRGEMDLLWFVGDVPYSVRPEVKYVFYQNAFPAPPGLKPDLLLPTTIWGETGGSYMGLKGNIKTAPDIAEPHRYELPNEEILAKIGNELKIRYKLPGLKKMDMSGAKKDSFIPEAGKAGRGKISFGKNGYTHTLIQEKNPHVFCNLSLSEGLTGFHDLVKQGEIVMSPHDAGKLGIKSGDVASVMSDDEEKKFKVRIRKNIMKGFLYLVTDHGKTEFINNPCPVKIRRENV